MTMQLTTLDQLTGFRIVRQLGLVQGSTVRSKHLGRDLMAGLKTLVGGELVGYTELLNEARAEAVERLQEAARQAGANAVVGLRFGSTSIADGAAEILVYGTAVLVEPAAGPSVQTAGHARSDA